MAGAMSAPLATASSPIVRPPDHVCAGCRYAIMAMAPVQKWVAEVLTEPDGIDELEAEF